MRGQWDAVIWLSRDSNAWLAERDSIRTDPTPGSEVPEIRDSAGIPLLTTKERVLGPHLRDQDWCRAAMDGSVRVARKNGEVRTYSFVALGGSELVDCTPFFPEHPFLGRSRFRATRNHYGQSACGTPMIPFRTIAVDNHVIPHGSVVYIPEARGIPIQLPHGETYLHDGYFFAADRGGDVDGNQIDIFLGSSTENPFLFVKSREKETFRAYVVSNPVILQAFKDSHFSKTPA